MEVYILSRGYGSTIQRGRLIVPLPKYCFNFLVDSMTDRLHDFGSNHVALRIDRHFNDDIALEVSRKSGAVYLRFWIHW